MSMSELSIWVRDTVHPCLPYQSTGHNWAAIILTCDLQPLSFGSVNNGVFRLTEQGAGGGRVHGQVEVPPGCYIVLAAAGCKNILTDWAYVNVGCNRKACVSLLPKRLTTCTGELIIALKIAQVLGPRFSAGSEPKQIDDGVLQNAITALEDLRANLTEDPALAALPLSFEDLLDMAQDDAKQGA